MLASLRHVFANAGYAVLAVFSGGAAFVLTTWLANLTLVRQIVTSGTIPLGAKLGILWDLVGSIGTNFTPFSAAMAIATAVLFGLNLSVSLYLFRRRRFLARNGWASTTTASVGGIASGLVGVGCAACGTVAIGPILAMFGAGGLLYALPFGGEEFAALGAAILAGSLVLGLRAISKLGACEMPVSAGA